MPRHLAAVSATLTATALAATLLTASAASTQATAALRYLHGQQASDGSVGGAAGVTEDTIIGWADNGYDPATLAASSGKTGWDYLSAQTGAGTADDNAGHTGKLILAVVAGHRDPHSFDGVDLVARLATFYDSSTGAFDVSGANIFSQSLGILADVADGTTPAAAAVARLACAQNSDGGFGYTIDTAVPSSTACGDTTDGSDTNSTAIAMQALRAAGVTTADAAARTYLSGQQQSDGGFGFGGPPSDPDSDATVIQALVAMGQDPSAAAWTKGGHTPLSNLLTFQGSTGGFTFPGNSAPDAFTTSEVPAALALTPYAAATTFASGASPGVAATPTPTPTAAATPAIHAAPLTGGAPIREAAPTGPPAGPAVAALVALGAVSLGAGVTTRRRRRRA